MKLYPRIAAVGVLSAALLIAAAPTAQARPLDRHLASQPATWFDAALASLSSLVFGAPAARAAHTPQTPQTKSIPVSHPGPTPMTGSCIDPNGHPKPCGPGGGSGGI